MPAQPLEIQIRDYIDARSCLDQRSLNGKDVAREFATLKHERDLIFDQLNARPELAEDAVFLMARGYLLAEARLDEAADCGADQKVFARELEVLRPQLLCRLIEFMSAEEAVNRKPTAKIKATRREPDVEDAPRILLPVDGSEPSRWAVDCAARMAEKLSATVLLLHVVPPAPPASDGLQVIILGSNEGKRLLSEAREQLPQDLEVNEILRQGNAAHEILAAAHDWRADMIVMGTHSRGRVAKFLLGSTAQAVVQRAVCPVVTLAHEPAQEMWRQLFPTGEESSNAVVAMT